MKEYIFKNAVPVWENGKENDINYNLCFRALIPYCENCKIALSASNMYQMFVNGHFVSEGPARAGHGYFRVDEIDITGYLENIKDNIVCIYVDGYNVPNFYLIKQPAFLCAEITANGETLAATGVKGFEAKYHNERLRKVARYSYQRTFTEVYNCDENYRKFETEPNFAFSPVSLTTCEKKDFIYRGVQYPEYSIIGADKIIKCGTVTYAETLSNPIRDRVILPQSSNYGFMLNELDIVSCDEAEKCVCTEFSGFEELTDIGGFELASNTFALYSLCGEKTGFIGIEAECSEDTTLFAVFDETLADGDINLKRSYPGNTTINVIIWKLKKGTYSLITNEPYSFKYIKIINKSANANLKIKSLKVTEFKNSATYIPLNSGIENLDKIYDAAYETFCQNAVDIYTDCPSRERAGWLCDSFFSGRVEKLLTGKSLIEKNFIENFILNKSKIWQNNPMLPMCYPADLDENSYIPQWALWFILELEEYMLRTGDFETIELAHDKTVKLLEYFSNFENEYGLLENLKGWSFVEWSKANDFIDGVNFPTNMLYAMALKSAYNLYEIDTYAEKSKKIKIAVQSLSYFDGFFHDHALRNSDGKLLTVAEDISETCQYYAFFTKTATPEKHQSLWQTLINDFGPEREQNKLWKNIYPSNAFIGYFLRLEVLVAANEKELALKNIESFFLPMAEKTGTLWEHNNTSASCNHGFASHVMVWLKELTKN